MGVLCVYKLCVCVTKSALGVRKLIFSVGYTFVIEVQVMEPVALTLTEKITSTLIGHEFKKRPEKPHSTALFALNLMQRQRRLQFSRVKNIGNVFELSGMAFHLAPPYGGLLVKQN